MVAVLISEVEETLAPQLLHETGILCDNRYLNTMLLSLRKFLRRIYTVKTVAAKNAHCLNVGFIATQLTKEPLVRPCPEQL
jgi:hypothetical protein